MSGELVAFLHGLGCSARSFAPLLERLRAAGSERELVAFDFQGFGGAAAPAGRPVSLGAFAEQAAAQIRAAGASRVHLVGHSMGGAVAVELHRSRPELAIESFVNLEGNLLPSDCTTSRHVSRQSLEQFRDRGFAALKREADVWARGGDPAGEQWRLDLDRTTAEAFHAAAVDLARISDEVYPSYRDWKTRSLYVVGERTLAANRATYDRLKADGLAVAIVPGAGHSMMIDRPEATAELCLGLWSVPPLPRSGRGPG